MTRAPSTMNVAFSRGALPSPTMSRAPSNTLMPDAVCAPTQTALETTSRMRRPTERTTRHDCVVTRCIEASSTRFEACTVPRRGLLIAARSSRSQDELLDAPHQELGDVDLVLGPAG